jgi:hypothetical protein
MPDVLSPTSPSTQLVSRHWALGLIGKFSSLAVLLAGGHGYHLRLLCRTKCFSKQVVLTCVARRFHPSLT